MYNRLVMFHYIAANRVDINDRTSASSIPRTELVRLLEHTNQLWTSDDNLADSDMDIIQRKRSREMSYMLYLDKRYPNALFVCTKGTDERKDWFINLDFKEVNFKIGNDTLKVHGGFLDVLNDYYYPLIKSEIAKCRQYYRDTYNQEINMVIFHGHSLGGAITSLLGTLFQTDRNFDLPCFNVTFAQPPCFAKQGKELFIKHNVRQITVTDDKDPVTFATSPFKPKFHVGKRIIIRDGKVDEIVDPIVFYKYSIKHILAIVSHVKSYTVEKHARINYINSLLTQPKGLL